MGTVQLTRRHVSRDIPVFDRGSDDVPIHPAAAAGLSTNAGPDFSWPRRYRTAADRLPGQVVTARILGDPRPDRAGRAPDCEESLKVERSLEAYRLLGKEPPEHDRYGRLDLDEVRRRLDALAPRRYRPIFKEAAE